MYLMISHALVLLSISVLPMGQPSWILYLYYGVLHWSLPSRQSRFLDKVRMHVKLSS
jgi:hypothetical protein